jgi:sulfocyanin
VHKVAVTTKTRPPDVTAARPKTDSVQAPPVPAGPVHVNEFVTYDARSKTVSLQLIAGYNGLNGSLNYNGATNGSHGISVPVGWRIHVAVLNRDSDLQHSAIVLHEVLPPPIEPNDPAFAGAALPDLGEGLQEDDTGTLDFVADRPGQFMIACGVPGHAQAGMWLKLVVVKDLAAPFYR